MFIINTNYTNSLRECSTPQIISCSTLVLATLPARAMKQVALTNRLLKEMFDQKNSKMSTTDVRVPA